MTLLPKTEHGLEELSEMLFVTTRRGGAMSVRVVLDNGMVIEGTAEQVRSTLEKLGFGGNREWYLSDTHGLMRIREMNSIHLRNAILKLYKKWVDSLHDIADPKTVVNEILEGNTDPTWIAMVEELSRRRI